MKCFLYITLTRALIWSLYIMLLRSHNSGLCSHSQRLLLVFSLAPFHAPKQTCWGLYLLRGADLSHETHACDSPSACFCFVYTFLMRVSSQIPNTCHFVAIWREQAWGKRHCPPNITLLWQCNVVSIIITSHRRKCHPGWKEGRPMDPNSHTAWS